MYEIEITRSAEKELAQLEPIIKTRISSKILVLEQNPRPPHVSKRLKVPFSGYRLRVGDWRVFYHVDETERKVVVYAIRHRREAYR